ncbi:MAG: site-2 protease family protein [Chloroflexi bacterium]|nr:site-2 protease family protein [Chloroflexota bacterium]
MLFAGLGFEVVYLIVALLTALTIHEASHAIIANWLGDPTAKNAGRISLNPFAHLEPIGVAMILTVGLGWGKPVIINADKLKPGPKIGMALVAAAGPVSNLLLAFVLAMPLRFHLLSLYPEKILELPFLPVGYQSIFYSVGRQVMYIAWLSLALAVFNLIPINPLDGSRLWQIILPTSWYMQIARIELIGLALVIGLVLSDRFLETNILARVLFPPVEALWRFFVGMTPPFHL